MPQSRLSQFQISGENIQTIMVAVPSRLQTTATPSHPLGGWRVAVKDILESKVSRHLSAIEHSMNYTHQHLKQLLVSSFWRRRALVF